MPNSPTNANYFGPPTPREPPPPQWAPEPPPGNAGQPLGGRPLNGGPLGGWGLAMDNFLPQCRNENHYYYYYNAAKLITFQLESSQVAFTTSYLQGVTFDHYMALLQFDPNNSILSNWLAFTQEFSSKFGIFDTIAEAEENLFNL
ncbi:hypothetical protein C0989_007387 [Termitomyces sp. Mn162]|nr:hypothetical protein C0989_007387 [Termitomyces sp. Mn162]